MNMKMECRYCHLDFPQDGCAGKSSIIIICPHCQNIVDRIQPHIYSFPWSEVHELPLYSETTDLSAKYDFSGYEPDESNGEEEAEQPGIGFVTIFSEPLPSIENYALFLNRIVPGYFCNFFSAFNKFCTEIERTSESKSKQTTREKKFVCIYVHTLSFLRILNIPFDVISSVCSLLEHPKILEFVWTQKNDSWLAAALVLHVCRRNPQHAYITLPFIAEKLAMKQYDISKIIKGINESLSDQENDPTSTQDNRATTLLPFFCKNLDWDHKIIELALSVAQSLEKHTTLTHPISIASLSMYFASKLENKKVRATDICKATGTAYSTLLNNYKKYKEAIFLEYSCTQ